MTMRMIAAGRKQILFLTDSKSYSARKKLRGYLDAVERAQVPGGEDRIVYVKNDIAFVRDFLREADLPPFDAVVSTEDGIAIGAVKYAAAAGIRIPEDLFVAGYNNYPIALACEPELTSIDNHMDQICRHTADRILARLKGGRTEGMPHKIVVPYSIIERKTTAFR